MVLLPHLFAVGAAVALALGEGGAALAPWQLPPRQMAAAPAVAQQQLAALKSAVCCQF